MWNHPKHEAGGGWGASKHNLCMLHNVAVICSSSIGRSVRINGWTIKNWRKEKKYAKSYMKKRLNISFSIRTQFYKFDPKPHYEQHTNYIFETLHQKWQLVLVENMVCDLQERFTELLHKIAVTNNPNDRDGSVTMATPTNKNDILTRESPFSQSRSFLCSKTCNTANLCWKYYIFFWITCKCLFWRY